jgi:hypothetical protein
LVDADGDLSGWALIVEARDTNTTGVANRVLMDCLWLVPAELYGRVAMNTAPFTSATITDSSVIVIHTSGAKMRPSQHDGDYPRLPPSGASRLILKASSASVSSQQDSSIDDVSISRRRHAQIPNYPDRMSDIGRLRLIVKHANGDTTRWGATKPKLTGY